MKNVGWAALIGAGIALVAFIIDWLGDKLDAPEEAEPLWPADKPFSRSYTWSPTDNPVDYKLVDRNFLNPVPETWKLP